MLLAVIWFAGTAIPVLAQEGSDRDEETAPSGAEASEPDLRPSAVIAPPPDIEAIEVTGEAISDTNVQDQAQAISAFSGADLDRASIVNMDSLQFNVPGLHVGQSGQDAIVTLRGIGTENASLTGEPGVAFHVDGINIGRPAAARVAFFDLQALEVKRGPQGLLGGKNSTSGHINVISRKPSDEFEVTGDVLFGNYDRRRLRGALNVPLGEYAATRVAFYQEDRDGYLDNPSLSSSHDPFDVGDLGLRAHLRLQPTDSIDWLLSYNWFRQKGAGPQSDIIPIQQDSLGCTLPGGQILNSSTMPRSAACFTQRILPQINLAGQVPVPPDPRYGPPSYLRIGGRIVQTIYSAVYEWQPAVEDGDPREVYSDVFSQQSNKYWGWSTDFNWTAPELPLLGETDLRLLGGFQQTRNFFLQDFDSTSAPLSSFDSNSNAKQYSAEVQWKGLGLGEQLEWQMSLFYLHEKADRPLSAPGLTEESGGIFIQQETNNKSYGAALHGNYSLTDNLRFSLGGRFIKDRKKNWLLRETFAASDQGRFRGCRGNLGFVGIPPAPFEPNPECSYLDRQFMWGTGLEWKPFGDDHLLYARLDRGAKTGGWRAGTVGTYAPEKIWAYAAGTKSEFFDQRLRVNLEGFFYNYGNLQLVVLDGTSLRTENTDARMYGMDLETQASPIEGLLLSGVVSYLHTETLDYYSLDPANPDQFLVSRLESRDLADAYQADGINIRYEDLTCLAPGFPQGIPCGTVPDTFGGLDDYSGNQLSRSPEWKFTLSGEYEIPLGRFGSLTPRVQYTWQDDTYFRAFNRDFDLQDAYHLTNLKLIWTSPEQFWTVEAFIENIEDEAPKQNVLVGPRYFGSPALAWYSTPRFYGLQVGFKY